MTTFHVKFYGEIERPEDGELYIVYGATYFSNKTFCSKELDNLHSAIELTKQTVEEKNYPISYFEDDTIAFHLRHVEILDNEGKKIMAGLADYFIGPEGVALQIEWLNIIHDKDKIAVIKAQQNNLLEEAALEASWDNFDTAKNLRKQADRMGLSLAG